MHYITFNTTGKPIIKIEKENNKYTTNEIIVLGKVVMENLEFNINGKLHFILSQKYTKRVGELLFGIL